MINPNDLYNITKLPADEELLNKLLNKYFSISYDDMSKSNDAHKLIDLLYNKINIYPANSNDKFNEQDIDNFNNEISQDYNNAGRPYNPSENGDIKNSLGVMPGWNTFKSWHLLGTEKVKSNDISHRFYFGIPNDKLYELSNVMYDKFKEAQIPFYFKTNAFDSEQRIDNIVLYTSTPLLEKTLNVIGQIKQERPDLMAQCCEPSILVGKIDDKIGYATEDTRSNTSYTDLMCNTFISSMYNTLRDYINNNPNSPLKGLFQQKIQEYIKNGKSIESDSVKNRILLDILINNDKDFKKSLLNEFQKELINKGIDIDNVCFNKTVKQEVEQCYGSKKLPSTITLPNGQVMTQQEYLEKNNVLYWVPPTSMVTLKNGKVMTGEEFVNGVLERANKFNSFQDLILFYGATVDRNINHSHENDSILRESNTQEEYGFESNEHRSMHM